MYMYITFVYMYNIGHMYNVHVVCIYMYIYIIKNTGLHADMCLHLYNVDMYM